MRVKKVLKTLLLIVALLVGLNIIALAVHERLLGGMTDKVENGQYFVWNEQNHGTFTEVSERSYSLLRFHEFSGFLTVLIWFAVVIGLVCLSRSVRNDHSNTRLAQ
jgi:hypothetical protein